MKNPNVPSATKENINHTNHKKENVMKPKRLTLPEKAQALFDRSSLPSRFRLTSCRILAPVMSKNSRLKARSIIFRGFPPKAMAEM